MSAMQETAHHVSHRAAGFAHPARNVGVLDIEPGMKVADFGSGSGAYVLAIAEALRNEGHVYAIDIQRDLLRRTKNESEKRGFHNVEIVWADLEKPTASKIKHASLDLVLISNLLFQVENKSAVLSEARRVLHDGGRLALIDWSDSFGGMGPQKKDVVTKEAALAFARENGFDLLREFQAGAHHWGLVFRLSPIMSRHINIHTP